MKKKKRCTRVGAGALAAVLAVTAAGVSVPALAQQAVRTESQSQMSSDPELVYVNNYSSTAQRSQNLTVIGNSTLGMQEMHREQPLMIPNGNRFPYRMITASARNTLNLWKRKVLILEEEQAGTERTLH